MRVKKLLLAAAAAGALAGLGSGIANAAPLASISGPVEFKFSGLTTSYNTQANTNETTWGVGNVVAITGPVSQLSPLLWASGEGGEYLSYMLYGVSDLSSSGGPAPTPFSLYNVGATGTGCGLFCNNIYIDVFKRNSGPIVGLPSLRDGYNSFPGVSTLDLWLRLQLIPGVVADDPLTAQDEGTLATLSQTVNGLTLPTSGVGIFFANVVDGSAKGLFDTGGFTTLLNTSADMSGRYDLTVNSGCAAGANCFQGTSHDPLLANAVPEPGSLALFGLGLLGLCGVGFGRRRTEK